MATETQNQKGVITLAELSVSKEFLLLTTKQRRWVNEFISTGDALGATRTAYGDSRPDSYVAMLTGKLLDAPNVRAVLSLFYGRTEKEQFLLDLQQTIAREKGGAAKVAAMRMFARLKFGIEAENPDPGDPADTESPVQKFAIGTVLVQDDKRYRVVAEEIS